MLPPATEQLWRRLEKEPLLAGWYLIGGTALSLRIAHRASEDLDFAWPLAGKLPGPALDALIRNLGSEGWRVQRNDDASAYEEFLLAGMSLHDHQQDAKANCRQHRGRARAQIGGGRRDPSLVRHVGQLHKKIDFAKITMARTALKMGQA